jgi:hypothetical protein
VETLYILISLRLSRGGKHLRNAGNVIHMVAQRHKEIKEQLAASGMHLQLHSSASLEGVPTADYKGQVMSS